MLIAGLIALLSLLMGVNELPFLFPKEEKVVKKVISDKQLLDQLDSLFKEVKKAEKKYKKGKSSYRKRLMKALKNPELTYSEFREVALAHDTVNQGAYDFIIEVRLVLADKLTEQQWQDILALSKEKYTKTSEKFEKIYPRFEKSMDKFKRKVGNIVDDKSRVETIIREVERFENQIWQNAQAVYAVNVFEDKELGKLKISRQSLITRLELPQQLRVQVVDELYNLHQTLTQNVTQEEWKKISKALMEIF